MLIHEIMDRLQKYLKDKNKVDQVKNIDIARAIGVNNPSQNVKNWDARGTIPWQELYDYAVKEKISLDWLLTGEEKNVPSCYVECNPEIKPLCEKLKNVINSDTKYSKTVIEIIDAFDLAVKDSREASLNRRKSDKIIADLTTRLEILEKKIDLKLNTDTD